MMRAPGVVRQLSRNQKLCAARVPLLRHFRRVDIDFAVTRRGIVTETANRNNNNDNDDNYAIINNNDRRTLLEFDCGFSTGNVRACARSYIDLDSRDDTLGGEIKPRRKNECGMISAQMRRTSRRRGDCRIRRA